MNRYSRDEVRSNLNQQPREVVIDEEQLHEMNKINTLVKELVRSKKDSESQLKMTQLLLRVYEEIIEYEGQQQAFTDTNLTSIISRAQAFFNQYTALNEQSKREEFEASISALLHALDIATIKAIFRGILHDGMKQHGKFIVLCCCMRLPRRDGRNALFAACMDLDLNSIDLKSTVAWLTF